MTRKQLAESVGVSLATVYGWEQRGFRPKAPKLVVIAKALSCDTSDLISQ